MNAIFIPQAVAIILIAMGLLALATPAYALGYLHGGRCSKITQPPAYFTVIMPAMHQADSTWRALQDEVSHD